MNEEPKPVKQKRSIKVKQSVFVVVLLAFISSTLLAITVIQYEQFTISNETHVAELYSTYKANMDSCKDAVKKGKGNVQNDCIAPINNSIIGKWLQQRDATLIITK